MIYKIEYKQEEHPDLAKLPDPYNRWGTSKIVIDVARQSVHAYWKDAKDPDYNGPGRAKLIKQGKRVRANARPTIRNQGQLRNLLLDTDRVCAITGESTQSALECAHIVGVENGGFETDRNAILLRADLHCLYDGRCFEISPAGKVVSVSEELSGYYRRLLTDKTLDTELIQRVANSLALRGAEP